MNGGEYVRCDDNITGRITRSRCNLKMTLEYEFSDVADTNPRLQKTKRMGNKLISVIFNVDAMILGYLVIFYIPPWKL